MIDKMEFEKDNENHIENQRNLINKVLDFMRDEGILSHLRYKRLKNDVRHWHLTKVGALENYRKRKNSLGGSI